MYLPELIGVNLRGLQKILSINPIPEYPAEALAQLEKTERQKKESEEFIIYPSELAE